MGTIETRQRRPRIGLLGIMQELYLPIHPGIKERQEAYAREVVAGLSSVADFDFPEAAVNRASIERILGDFNRKDLDGVMIVMLTYGASFLTYNALRANRLPVFLANIQPEQQVGTDWDMGDLTYNQGIHGAQDMASALLWTGTKFSVWTGNWRDAGFGEAVSRWATIAKVVHDLPSVKIAQVGQMVGMGDIQTNTAAVLSRFGVQVDQMGIGLVHGEMEGASEAEVSAAVSEDRSNFEIDGKLSDDAHSYAARFQVGLSRVLVAGGYSGISVYFNAPADDGRFRQLPLLAASNLMAAGYGYGGEGDIMSTLLVTMGQMIAADATFIEMYAMDFPGNSILMSHMGEGNWKISRTDRRPRLVDRPLGIGGLENPPTVVFQAQPGPATLSNLIALPDGGFRLLVSTGEILDTPEMPNVEMPYYHYRPDTGIAACQNAWLQNGGSHHQCLHLGNVEPLWRELATALDIEYRRV